MVPLSCRSGMPALGCRCHSCRARAREDLEDQRPPVMLLEPTQRTQSIGRGSCPLVQSLLMPERNWTNGCQGGSTENRGMRSNYVHTLNVSSACVGIHCRGKCRKEKIQLIPRFQTEENPNKQFEGGCCVSVTEKKQSSRSQE